MMAVARTPASSGLTSTATHGDTAILKHRHHGQTHPLPLPDLFTACAVAVALTELGIDHDPCLLSSANDPKIAGAASRWDALQRQESGRVTSRPVPRSPGRSAVPGCERSAVAV